MNRCIRRLPQTDVETLTILTLWSGRPDLRASSTKMSPSQSKSYKDVPFRKLIEKLCGLSVLLYDNKQKIEKMALFISQAALVM